jgi:integrase
MDALKQFFSWAGDRYDIPPIKWPKTSIPEMKFRKTVSIADQETILAEVEKITKATRPRAWLAIKWLATYISVRPAEMLSLTEGQVDRRRGLLIIPHPKERRPKVVPLLDEDQAILASLPLAFDPETPFFRHEKHASRRHAGKRLGSSCLYKDWKAACRRLGIEGVDLYGGTKHSTAMGLREVATFEEVRKMTGHTTNKAFDRYLQLEGESMRSLFARRQPLTKARPDNGLTMDLKGGPSPQILEFKR